MSLSKRHSLFWTESEDNESEPTSTLVVSSPNGLYVDIRPFTQESEESTEENGGFDWFFAGFEIPFADSSKVEFNHEFFDSAYINHYYKNGFSGKGFTIGTDLGDFSDSKNPDEVKRGIRVETGVLCNPKTGNVEPYVEKWVTCNSEHTPELIFIGDYKSKLRCIVLDTKDGGITDNELKTDAVIGRFIVLDKWVQGVIWDKSVTNKTDSLGVVRFCDETHPLITYGGQIDKFPKLLDLKRGLKVDDSVIVEGVKWIVKEVNSW